MKACSSPAKTRTKKGSKPVPSIIVAQQFLELQQLRRKLRIAQCGRLASPCHEAQLPKVRFVARGVLFQIGARPWKNGD
jgi:hypothetical protein